MKMGLAALVAVALTSAMLSGFGLGIFLDNQRVYGVRVRTVGLPSNNFGIFTSMHDGNEVAELDFGEIGAGEEFELTYFLRSKGVVNREYSMTWSVEDWPGNGISIAGSWNGEVGAWGANEVRRWNTTETVALSWSVKVSTGVSSMEVTCTLLLTAYA